VFRLIVSIYFLWLTIILYGMPKIRNSLSASIRQWIRPYNQDAEILFTDRKIVTCLLCGSKPIQCKKKNHVDSHCTLAAHIAAVNRVQKSKVRQSTLRYTSHEVGSTFNDDLCEAFLAANIPLAKLSINPTLKSFLQKYTQVNVPPPLPPHGEISKFSYVPNLPRNLPIRETPKFICPTLPPFL
jgi:hypothetical protein